MEKPKSLANPPSTLSPKAAQVWREVVARYGARRYDPCQHLLANYCEISADLVSARKEFAKQGQPWTTPRAKGGTVAHPLVTVMTRLANLQSAYARQLGIVPDTNPRVKA